MVGLDRQRILSARLNRAGEICLKRSQGSRMMGHPLTVEEHVGPVVDRAEEDFGDLAISQLAGPGFSAGR